MSASPASTWTALADGASPTIRRSPASSLTARSMVVLPEPACPCTPTVRWGESRIARAAWRWPSFSPAASSPASIDDAGDRPCPASRPARMPAMRSRSASRARSVTKARSARLATASIRCPSRRSWAMPASSASRECRPPPCARAQARRSLAANTVRRSSRCSTARLTTASADGSSFASCAADAAAPMPLRPLARSRSRAGPISRARSRHVSCRTCRSGSALRCRV